MQNMIKMHSGNCLLLLLQGVDPHGTHPHCCLPQSAHKVWSVIDMSSGAFEAQPSLQTVPGCTIPMHSIYARQMCRSGSHHIYLTLISSTSSRQLVSRVLVDENLCCGQQRSTQMSSWCCGQSVSIIDAVCVYPMMQCACIAQLPDELKMQ